MEDVRPYRSRVEEEEVEREERSELDLRSSEDEEVPFHVPRD